MKSYYAWLRSLKVDGESEISEILKAFSEMKNSNEKTKIE